MKTFLKMLLLTLMITFPVSNLTANWTQVGFDSISNRTITFLNANTGFMIKSNKTFFKTTDMGLTWNQFAHYNAPFLTSGGYFLDEENFSFIYHVDVPIVTTNSGNNWIVGTDLPRMPNSSVSVLNLKKIIQYNENITFVCGTEFGTYTTGGFFATGVIHKTTNSGLNWELSLRLASPELYDSKFNQEGDLYCVWANLHKSTNLGQSWEYISNLANPIYSMSDFFGETVYFITTNGKILKSVNGGVTISNTFQTDINDTLRKAHFFDSERGYVAGDQGRIYYTSDGGTSWITQNTGTDKNIYDIAFINEDTIYAIGDNGLMLVTYNGGFTNISNVSTELPSMFELHQNFPNPFNPATTLSFDIPQTALVKLSVYDALGKEVATLVNENLTAGVYQYQFTIDKYQLPSGIYFYTITAGEFRDTKRMLLLK